MAEFINTIDVLGDDAVFDSIINRTIAEFKDDRIETVRDYAFYQCSNLTEVDLPSATSVKYSAFTGCSALTKVNIPAVKAIEPYNAFSNCRSIKEIVLPVCTKIGHGAFSFCTGLEKVDCKATGSIEIGNSAFGSATALKALIIRSNSVATMLSTNALYESGIFFDKGYIYVPSALIDSYKAANNWSTYADQFRKLEEWTVDGTVTGELDTNRHMVRFFNDDGTLLGYKVVPHGGTATYDGTPVKPGVDDPENYKFLGWNPEPINVTTYMDCYAKFKSTALVSRKIVDRSISGEYVNNRVESIGNLAFSNCSELTSVDFPEVISVGDYAFQNCSKLTSINLPVAKSIGNGAFQGCSKLASINIPAVTSIPEYAFAADTELTSVDFPEVISVGNYAFQSCRKLTSINLPVATTINHWAFYGCSALTRVDLPVATSFGVNVFYNISAFDTLILRNKTQVATLGAKNALTGTSIASGNGYIYVPSALIDSYKVATNWSDFAAQFRAIEYYPEICGGD